MWNTFKKVTYISRKKKKKKKKEEEEEEYTWIILQTL